MSTKPRRNLPLGFNFDSLPRQDKQHLFYAGLKAVSEARNPEVQRKHQIEFKK